MSRALILEPECVTGREGERNIADRSARFREMFEKHLDVIWRVLRRMGLSATEAEDAGQQVFEIAWKKLDRIEYGKERAYLIGSARRVASTWLRSRSRRDHKHASSEVVDLLQDHRPDPQQHLRRQRACELLDRVLSTIPMKFAEVFILHELEEMTAVEIAETLDIRPGTVASRLRRARELFRAGIRRLTRDWMGGVP